MIRRITAAVALCVVLPLAAQTLAPDDFAWQGTLQAPAGASLVRVALPPQALLRLQSASAADLRVFDGQGRLVPFALSATPADAPAARPATRPYAALPLFSATAAGAAPRGSVQVRVDDGAQRRSVWIQMPAAGTAAPAGAQRLPAAIFDTRGETARLGAITVSGTLPPNAPVHVRVTTSTDLAQWTPVATAGRLYRFDGDGAPANMTLEFDTPLALDKRYLKLQWDGHDGVAIASVTGQIASGPPRPPRTWAALPAGRADGATALEWELGFSTPIAELELLTDQSNVLVPVRILGRNQVSEPWRALASTVVYRLGLPGSDTTNTPAALPGGTVRWLRVEATLGSRLEGVPLRVRAGFAPVQVVFVAGGSGPYRLAAGREATAAAALPLGMIAAATPQKIDELPAAQLVSATERPVRAPSVWSRWLPRGVDERSAVLWGVLGAGVLLLGGVAWTLLRQLNAKPPG